MKTYLDSTVLVSLLHAHSRFKSAADAALADASGHAFTSTHALVETYRTLTTLRLPIPPRAARQLVVGLETVVRVTQISRSVYLRGTVGGRPPRSRRPHRLRCPPLSCRAGRQGAADRDTEREPLPPLLRSGRGARIDGVTTVGRAVAFAAEHVRNPEERLRRPRSILERSRNCGRLNGRQGDGRSENLPCTGRPSRPVFCRSNPGCRELHHQYLEGPPSPLYHVYLNPPSVVDPCRRLKVSHGRQFQRRVARGMLSLMQLAKFVLPLLLLQGICIPATVLASTASCMSDCDADQHVSVDELILLVRIARRTCAHPLP